MAKAGRCFSIPLLRVTAKLVGIAGIPGFFWPRPVCRVDGAGPPAFESAHRHANHYQSGQVCPTLQAFGAGTIHTFFTIVRVIVQVASSF